MIAWWNSLTWQGKFVSSIVGVNILLGLLALTAITLRAVGILPPAQEFLYVPPPRFDVRQCRGDEVERRYGDSGSFDELNDDIQLEIRLNCDRMRRSIEER